MDDGKQDDKDDEKKSITERIADTVKGIVDSTSEAAMKAMKPDLNKIATETNEQLLVGDAAIAPEAVTAIADISPKKRAAPKRATKRVAKARKAAQVETSTKKSEARKTTKKAIPKKKKSKAKAANKTVKPSALKKGNQGN